MQITTCEGRINMKRINEIYKQNPGTERVIQFGEGGFLRAFIDWMLDKLNKSGLSDAKSVIVQPILHVRKAHGAGLRVYAHSPRCRKR